MSESISEQKPVTFLSLSGAFQVLWKPEKPEYGPGGVLKGRTPSQFIKFPFDTGKGMGIFITSDSEKIKFIKDLSYFGTKIVIDEPIQLNPGQKLGETKEDKQFKSLEFMNEKVLGAMSKDDVLKLWQEIKGTDDSDFPEDATKKDIIETVLKRKESISPSK